MSFLIMTGSSQNLPPEIPERTAFFIKSSIKWAKIVQKAPKRALMKDITKVS